MRIYSRIIGKLQTATAKAGAKSNLWTRLHYAFLDHSFVREQRTLLAGRAAYYKSLHSPEGTLALLRRNVHRLEKGILMKPRRVPFAVNYVGETVSAFVVASNSSAGNIDAQELAWANDVLTEYFDIHEDCDAVNKQRKIFNNVRRDTTLPSPRIPYLRDLSPPPVTFEALSSLAHRRRSVRWFLPQKVERILLEKALEVGAQAPSACNRQPFQFRFFDEPDLVRKVIEIPFGLVGYGHQVPVVAVVIGQQRHYFNDRDRHLLYIDGSLVTMGFLFALETLGLASCCVNWPDIEDKEREMAGLLKLAPDERPVMLLAIGYPDPEGMVANSTKKSLNQLRKYNFE
jgi:nitroreductase